MIYLYTGNGEGKTTAALGHALRALGYGKKIAMVCFMKGRETGELNFSKKYKKNFELFQFGAGNFTNLKKPSKADKLLARDALRFSKKLIQSKKYDLVILDEINVAVGFGLVSKQTVLKVLGKAPKDRVIFLTGRKAPPEFIKIADLVTEMKEIKHPFKKGIQAKKGLDY